MVRAYHHIRRALSIPCPNSGAWNTPLVDAEGNVYYSVANGYYSHNSPESTQSKRFYEQALLHEQPRETRRRDRRAALALPGHSERLLGLGSAPDDKQTVAPESEEGVWCVNEGEPSKRARSQAFRDDGVERLTYDNPYSLGLERVWFDGKIVYAVERGEVELEFNENRVVRGNKVAQEYQVVYGVELDARGKLKDGREPERIEGRLGSSRAGTRRRVGSILVS